MESPAARRPPISAVVITRDAARLLATVLDALQWCDEILVVDSGSVDDTVAIAESRGARVLHRAFDGYGPQKAFAASAARNDWVFIVDADEVVTDELRAEIEAKVAAADAGRLAARGFEVPISLVFLGRVMRGGQYKMPHLRLFDRRHGNYNAARVHETVVLDAPVARLEHHMLHSSYGSLHQYFEKFNAYTTAGAEELHDRGGGRTASAASIVLRFPVTFFKEYVLRANFLNGYAGLVWSLFSAIYPVVKYAKLRELLESRE